MTVPAAERSASAREDPSAVPEAPDLGPLFRCARDAMFALDAADGRIVAWNPAATALLAYDTATALGLSLASLIPPASRARDGIASWLAAAATGEAAPAAQLELPLLRRDGEERRVELTLSPLPAIAADGLLVLAVARDVTARARSEAALRAGAESFATLFGATAEGITIAHNGTLLAVNAALAAMMRCAPADLVGRRIADLTPPEYQEQVLGAIRAGDERPHETGVLRPDGSIFFAELIGRGIRYEGRDARLTTFRDITDRKAAEAALRASEARFAAFMDHNPAAGFIKDEARRFIYANRAFEQHFGIAQADLIGKTNDDLWPAATAHRLRELDAGVLGDNRAAELIEDLPTPGGLRRWQIYKFPLVAAAGVRYLGGMAVDITDRVRAEERLLALHDASVQMAAVRQPRDLVPQLLQQAVGLLGADSGTFYTWESATRLLRCTYNWRVPSDDTTPDQRPGQGLAGQVFVTRRTQVVNDYLTWEHAMPSGLAAGLRAALAVPLVRAGTILGVVVVRSYDDAIHFDEADARLLELFGDQAAIALENANLDDLAHSELAERRRTEAHLRASEARFRALAEASFEAIVINEAEAIREVNPAFSTLFGYTAEEAVTMNIHDIVAPELHDMMRAHFRSEGEQTYEAVGLRRDGSRFPMEVRGRTALLDGRTVRIAAIRDIGERKRYEAELARRAIHDPLTDLPNRAHLLDWLGDALARGPVGVLFVDLDSFKAVNDRLGHAGGDRLLVRVARLLQSCVRPGDLVARLGGDEFVVALPGMADDRAATAISRRILAGFATPGTLAESGVGVSIGIAVGANEPPEGVLRRADEALYAAKGSGKGRYAVWSAALVSAAS